MKTAGSPKQGKNWSVAENEQLLWRQFQEGNRSAFERLIKLYHRSLFRYAAKFCQDPYQIEDCIQDCFLYLWEHRLTLSVPVSVRWYLLKTVRNRLFLAIKKTADCPIPPDYEGEMILDNIEEWTIRAETGSEHQQRLQRLVDRLPERQREALYLKYFREFTNDQIAQTMGVNRQSAANFLFRALSTLRAHW